METTNKTGLYIHVPFCERKCGYCSFYSVELRAGNIDSWLESIANEAKNFRATHIDTLYIGGGTPSVLNISRWEKLLRIIKENFDVDNLLEATTEANPNSLTREHIKFFQANNLTRISLGVQSLNDNELKTLGRIHDSDKALKAMELVKDSGLSLNCDLIFGIPGQTLRTWAKSLKGVLKFADHVSTYQLTLEPDTPLGKIYDNESLNQQGYKFYRYSQYYLPRRNFAQYEISNFAREGYECQHNLLYWNHSNVIALGPSAVSYINGVRIKRTPEGMIEREELSARERAIELAILSLRTKWGVKREGLLPEVESVIDSLPDDLFVKSDERIVLSPRGMRLGNSIWSEIIDA